jgi:hypothetical protein
MSKKYSVKYEFIGGAEQNINEFINLLFKTLIVNKLTHWKTTSHSLHKATDQFDDVLSGLIDKFVEIFIGSNNPVAVKQNLQIGNIQINTINESSLVDALNQLKVYLINLQTNLGLSSISTDLLNIRDELLGEINKMFYLLTLN